MKSELEITFSESDVSDVSAVSPMLAELRTLLKTHIWFEDLGYYDLLAIWIAGTHIHDIFSMYPYLYVTGTKGAGKTTRLGEAIKRLSREGLSAAVITKSALFRKVDQDHPTLILDEQEVMPREIKDLLKTGNERSGKAVVNVQVGTEWVPTEFSTYCPKVVISNGSLDSFLLDRSIEINMVKKKNSGTVPIPNGDWKELHEKLYDHMTNIANKRTVMEEYANLMKSAGERKDEFWAPIIAVSRLFNVENDIVALRDKTEKMKEYEDDSPERTMLTVLQALVNRKDYYQVKQILSAFKSFDTDFSAWNAKKLGRLLRRIFDPVSTKKTGTGISYWFEPGMIQRKIQDYGYEIKTSDKSQTTLTEHSNPNLLDIQWQEEVIDFWQKHETSP